MVEQMTEHAPFSSYGLENHGFAELSRIYWNLSTPALYERAIANREGMVVHNGPIAVRTGSYTGRSPKDKFIVRDEETTDKVWWGPINSPFDPQAFDHLHRRMMAYFQQKEVYVQDCFAGADPQFRVPIRVVTEYAWHSLFARYMFVRPDWDKHAGGHVPEFTVLNAANCLAAFTAAVEGLGLEIEAAQAGIAALEGIPGRMEAIRVGQDFLAIVDFAHTPNALRRALEAARRLVEGRVIAVFGSAGLRDQAKRLDGAAILEIARRYPLPSLVLAIVNRRGSDLTDKADGVIYTSDGRDVEMSVASTKAFYAQCAAGHLLAHALARALGSSMPSRRSSARWRMPAKV